MRKYEITITGSTPLLMHPANIEWADKLAEWQSDAANKNASKPGDDRTPAWRWLGNLYHDGKLVAVPSDNLMRCLMEGGAMVPVPGRGKKTFKSQTQSGMMVNEPYWPIDVGGSGVRMADIEPLMQSKDFAHHKTTAEQLGFRLLVKRAVVKTAKHVRVRPCFDRWSITGTVSVWDEQITDRVLAEILQYAGQYKGLCDWRPGSKTPGSYGMFTAAVSAI